MSTKVNIAVDFGQETKLFSFKDQRLKDQEGKVITFIVRGFNHVKS
jgi:hypothetical protein